MNFKARHGGPVKPKESPSDALQHLDSVQSLAELTSGMRRLNSIDEMKKEAKKPRAKLHIQIEQVDPSIEELRSPGGTREKKGNFGTDRRFKRSFAQGLSLNLAGASNDEVEQTQSYKITESGTIDLEGFQINEKGISKTGEMKDHRNLQERILRLDVLGKGAGGVVYKAIDLLTLHLVALKVIPVFESDKRHQLVTELQSLYANIVPYEVDQGRPGKNCQYLVSFYDAFLNANAGNVSMVVEYMDGGSLQDIVNTGGCNSEKVLANISFNILKVRNTRPVFRYPKTHAMILGFGLYPRASSDSS